MKKRNMTIAADAALMPAGCSANKEDRRTVIYEDMKADFEKSGLLSSNIGIMTKTEQDGAVTYGECGSGGAAVNEKMQPAGTTPGGSLDGRDFRSGVRIPAGELKAVIEEWKAQ